MTAPPHRSTRLIAMLTALTALAGTTALTLPAADAATLPGPPNNPSRHYELVSPVDKHGGAVGRVTGAQHATDDGSKFSFASTEAFADSVGTTNPNYYVATRGATGWSSHSLVPRLPVAVNHAFDFAQALSDDLSAGIFILTGQITSDTPDNPDPREQHIYAVDPDRSAHLIAAVSPENQAIGAAAAALGQSADGSVSAGWSGLPLTPNSTGPGPWVYLRSHGQLQLASIGPDGQPLTVPVAGVGHNERGSNDSLVVNGLSKDGRRMVFVTEEANYADTSGRKYWTGDIYDRIDGTSTVQVNASKRDTPDPAGHQPALPLGATPSGSRVFFRSCEKLTDDASATGCDIYRYEVATDGLTDLTPDRVGTPEVGANFGAELLDVSADGERAYIREGDTVTMFDHGARPTFTLTGPFQNGVETSPDGRYLIIATTTNLTGYDGQGTMQVYVRDAEAGGGAGQWTCASCPAGHAASGDAMTDAPRSIGTNSGPPHFRPGAISDNGKVFFTSPEALVAEDANGRRDAYEHDLATGVTRLVTRGTSSRDSYFFGATPDGSSVFVLTAEKLLPADNDVAQDVYVARTGPGLDGGGGSIGLPCDADQCQGSPSPAPSEMEPGTPSGPGDQRPGARGSVTLQRLSKSQRAALARGRRVTVRVATNRSGTITMLATAAIDSRTRLVAKATTRGRGSGMSKVTIRLSRAARRALARSGRLSLTIVAHLSGAAAESELTIALRRAKTNRKAGR